MDSKIADVIGIRYAPVAVIFTDVKPEPALQFKEGARGCVVSMLNAAAKGKTAVFDRKTFGCPGGGTGLGFGNTYKNFPGGIEYFLSTGNKELANTDAGRNILKNMPALEHGERYVKSPGIARKFADSLPFVDVPTKYIVFKPLQSLSEGETPRVIIFLANPDQLSALVILAHYSSETNDNVIAPFGAGCHSVCLLAYREAEAEKPRAIIGLTDISARTHVGRDILSFTVPYKMFLQMESDVAGSFLECDEWLKVRERNNGN